MSTRYQLPLKVALALTLAIVTALWLGWDRPYWAAFSVLVMAVTETTGHSLKKGRHRIIGTVSGVLVAFVLAGHFAQEPSLMLLSYILYAAICVYQQTNPRNGYAWSISIMITTIVLVMGGLSGTQTFEVAILRIQETLLGVICFSVVFSLIWPASSRVVLLTTLKSYYEKQEHQVEAILNELDQVNSFKRDYSLGNSVGRLTRLDDLIQAANADSYEVSSAHPLWQQWLRQQNEWALLCGHLYEATRLLDAPFTVSQREQIRSMLMHLKQRASHSVALFNQCIKTNSYDKFQDNEHWLENPIAERITLLLPTVLSRESGAQSHGALRLLENILSQMDALHYAMHESLLMAVGVKTESTTSQTAHTASGKSRWSLRITLDPERVIHAFKASIIIGISIALWLYVPMPSGAMIVVFGANLGAVVLSMPFANMRSLSLYVIGWASLILVQYTFILPHLSEVWQLGAFYFLNTFVIWFVYCKPQDIFHRLIGTMSLVLMTKSVMQLSPTYDIRSAILVLMLMSIAMLVIFFVNYGVFSANPERVFLRNFGHFRRSLQLSLQSLLDHRTKQIVSFVRPSFIRNIATAETACAVIDWRAFPDLTQADAQQLISRGYSLCLHYKAFIDNYQQWLKTNYCSAIDKKIQRSISDMVRLLDKSMISEVTTVHGEELQQLQQHLQAYLYGFEHHSLLQFTFSQQQADQSYQLLISLQILIESLQQLQQDTNLKDFYTLRLSPFAI